MLLRAGARATVHDTVFRYNRAGEGSVAGLLSGRNDDDSIGGVAWFHDCSFINNTESFPSMIAIVDRQARVYTNTNGLTVRQTHCKNKYQSGDDGDTDTDHCALKPYKLAPLSARQEGSSKDVFAHVAAGALALPRPSDTAFRQVIGEQVTCTRMPSPHVLALPSGADMTLVDGPWEKGLALGWLDYTILSLALCIVLAHTIAVIYSILQCYQTVLRTVGLAHRVAKAMLRWATAAVIQVKEARAKAVECNGLTRGAGGVALEVVELREGYVSDSCDCNPSTDPIQRSTIDLTM